jgi:SprA-related family
MGISGLSASTGYHSVAPTRQLHGVGCSCATCQGSISATPTQNTQAISVSSTEKSNTTSAFSNLSDEALTQVHQLQARDREVRQHEQAHLAASGGLAVSGPSFTYQKGPDGVSYAIGGEVNIDVSPGSTPEETIARAKTIQAAALAPASPSGPDRAVAAQARQMEQDARIAQNQQKIETPDNKIRQSIEQTYGVRAEFPGAGVNQINTYA